jgi:penicillin-binding protein 1C
MDYKKLFTIISKVKLRWRIAAIVLVIISVVYFFVLPTKLFLDPYSTVLHARSGELLSASIAKDGQWRFPQSDTVPQKFIDALITFEDKRFFDHPGVDVLSLGRAFRQNISAGKIVSGGSTVTMQVIRLSRKEKSRSVLEKITELVLATRLELRDSKNEILSKYASHAPFGGNVVGLEAACWRYFGNTSKELSWAEAALLAVLPNSPALIHPGKNRLLLKQKRDRLLDKLFKSGKMDSFTCSLAKEEPIPDEPNALPRHARHLINRITKDGFGEHEITSTIDYNTQLRVEQILQDHHQNLKANQIFNGAALVLDVKTGNTLAYVGNVSAQKNSRGNEVDLITSPRSTGSILKPFLYAAMLDEGKILPKTLLPDVPIFINGFSPKNFTKEYDGAVHADRALIRSLNVPAVHLLRDYRYEKFHTLLKNVGMTTLNNPPDHYGLALILGGAEGTLWDISGIYASMARTLNNFYQHPGKNRYDKKDFHQPQYKELDHASENPLDESSWLMASSIYLTFDALKELYRPGEESGWKYFNSSKKIAWKTGTSFGFRDGWAIGVTPEYVVGVWVGNADGEGRPGLTGTEAAAPVMFDIFSALPATSWFSKPAMEMQKIVTCKKSGLRASLNCIDHDTIFVSKQSLETPLCPYHKMIHLTKDEKFQVNSACMNVNTMKHLTWFVLPPVQEYYYKTKNLSYKSLPPFRKDCQISSPLTTMDLIYPKHNARIFIPRGLDGKPGNTVFELAHRNGEATVFWHLDGVYIGSTKSIHHMAMHPAQGKHVLMLIDEYGESLERHFDVISKM